MVFFEFFITIQSVLRLTKTVSTTSCRITELVKPILWAMETIFVVDSFYEAWGHGGLVVMDPLCQLSMNKSGQFYYSFCTRLLVK